MLFDCFVLRKVLLRSVFSSLCFFQKSIDVSIFVPVEFPDKLIHELLATYGTMKPTIRHLHLKEPGLKHVENGVRVVTFTEMTRSIPHTIVYRNTPLRVRYMGQPTLCFKCVSPEHVLGTARKIKRLRSRRPWRPKSWELPRIARPRPWRSMLQRGQIWPFLPTRNRIWKTWPLERSPNLSASVSASPDVENMEVLPNQPHTNDTPELFSLPVSEPNVETFHRRGGTVVRERCRVKFNGSWRMHLP